MNDPEGRNESVMKLNALHPGQSAVIRAVGGEGALRQHFLDMGVIPGTEVTVIDPPPGGRGKD